MKKRNRAESIRGARVVGLWEKDISIAKTEREGQVVLIRIVRYLTDEELKKKHCPPYAHVIGRKRRRRIYWAYCKVAR